MFPLSATETAAMAANMWSLDKYVNLSIRMADRSTHATYTVIACVTKVSSSGPDGMLQDVTTHGSGGWQEKIATLKQGGKFVFEVIYAAGDHADLISAALAQTTEFFKLYLGGSAGLSFTALVGMQFHRGVGIVRDRIVFTLEVNSAVAVF